MRSWRLLVHAEQSRIVPGSYRERRCGAGDPRVVLHERPGDRAAARGDEPRPKGEGRGSEWYWGRQVSRSPSRPSRLAAASSRSGRKRDDRQPCSAPPAMRACATATSSAATAGLAVKWNAPDRHRPKGGGSPPYAVKADYPQRVLNRDGTWLLT